MLPVVDRPAIQYVVEEAVRAGLSDVLMITGRGKRSLEDHFDRAWELEAALEAKATRTGWSRSGSRPTWPTSTTPGRAIRAVWATPFSVPATTSATSRSPSCWRRLIDERDELLTRMIGVQRQTKGSVVALMEVDPSQVHLYGCAAVEATGVDDVLRVTGMVEKPDPKDAPSNLAVIGRYVLHPQVFEVLRETKPGRGNEIQLTDALQELAGAPDQPGGGVYGVVFKGRRYDTGDRLDYLKAVVRLGSEREDLGPDLRAFLREFVASLPAE